MLRKKPLVTIVTPSYNHGQFIEETIRSVFSQDYPETEYIIVDGGSRDNTAEVLRKYSGNKMKWISEPDQGQSEALNKGFRRANGEILGWLNADDTYNPETISTVVRHFLNHPGDIMVYGDAYFIDKEGRIMGQYPTEPFNLKGLSEACFICQPSVFVRSEVFEKVGVLNESLHTCMDYDYWIRIARRYSSQSISYLRGEFLANSRVYGDIKTFRMRETVYQEAMKVVKKHFGYVPWPWVFNYANDVLLKKKRARNQWLGSLTNLFILPYFTFLLLRNWRGYEYLFRYLRSK